MDIWYTTTPREYDAGILIVGHNVHPYHVIPPNAENFVSIGLMTAECTSKVHVISVPFSLQTLLNFCSTYQRVEFTCLETSSTLTLLVSVAAKILPLIHIIYLLINPRRACAARVT